MFNQPRRRPFYIYNDDAHENRRQERRPRLEPASVIKKQIIVTREAVTSPRPGRLRRATDSFEKKNSGRRFFLFVKGSRVFAAALILF